MDPARIFQAQSMQTRQHGTMMRTKIQELWGKANMASNIKAVWNALTPKQRGALISSSRNIILEVRQAHEIRVIGNLPEPKSKFVKLLHVCCPEMFDEKTNETGKIEGMSMSLFLTLIVDEKENSKENFAMKKAQEEIDAFLRERNYSVFDQFKSAPNEKMLNVMLCIEQRPMWLINFALCVIAEFCSVLSSMEPVDDDDEEAAQAEEQLIEPSDQEAHQEAQCTATNASS